MIITALVDSSPMYDYSMKPTGRLLTRDGFDRSLANKQGRHALMLRAGFASFLTIVLVLNSYNNTADMSVRQKVPAQHENIEAEQKNLITDKGEIVENSLPGTKEESNQQSSDYQNLLSVPFYVYQDLQWFNNATVGKT